MADSKNKLLLPGTNSGAFSVLNDIWERNAKVEEEIQKNQELIEDVIPSTEEFVNTSLKNENDTKAVEAWVMEKLDKLRKKKIEDKKSVGNLNELLDEVEKSYFKKAEAADKTSKSIKKTATEIGKTLAKKTASNAKKLSSASLKAVDKVIKTGDVAFKSVSKLSNSAESAYKKITGVFGKNAFCPIWESKMGRFFTWLNGPGITVWSLLKNGGIIWSSIKFIKEGVMSFIEGTYTIMASLGKVGWKAVRSLISYTLMPFKAVANYMSSALKFFLTSPTGLLLLAGGIAVAAIFIWPVVKPFFESLFNNVWKWLSDNFTSALKNIKDTKFYKHLKDGAIYVKDKVLTLIGNFFTKERMADYYNNTIGKWTGVSSSDLSKIFSDIKQFGMSAWGNLKEMFFQIKDSSLFEELGITYDVIKTFVVGEERVINEKAFADSQRRTKSGISEALNTQLESILQNQLTDTFFSKYNGHASPEAKAGLQKDGQSYIDNIFIKNIGSLSPDPSMQAFISSSINVNLNSIVDEIFNLNSSTLQNYKNNAQTNLLKSSTQIDDLHEIINNKNLQSVDAASALSKELDVAFSKTRQDNKFEAYLDMQAKQRNIAFNEKDKGFALMQTFFDTQTNLNNAAISRITTVQKGYQTLTENMISQIYVVQDKVNELMKNADNQTSGQFIIAFRNFLQDTGLNLKLSEDQAAALLKQLMQQNKKLGSSVINLDKLKDFDLLSTKAEYGMVALKPTFIQVAEAGSPEMVIPLNKDGIRFIAETMQNFEIKDDETKPVNRQTQIVRTIKNSKKQKPNESIFDMKNMSEGFLGII